MTDTMADYLTDDMLLAPMMPHDIGTSRDELTPCDNVIDIVIRATEAALQHTSSTKQVLQQLDINNLQDRGNNDR